MSPAEKRFLRDAVAAERAAWARWQRAKPADEPAAYATWRAAAGRRRAAETLLADVIDA